jgi:DNA-binding MarR family transcriptional regulator
MKRHPIIGIKNREEVIYFPTRFRDTNYTKNAWWLYMVIASECGKNKSYSTNLTNKELARESKLSESSISRALKFLEKDHFIERDHLGHIREIKLLDY